MAVDLPAKPPKKNTIPRDQIPPGDCLCDHCVGKCCRYFSLPIDTPKTWNDYDILRGHLAHGQTLIYVDKKTWFLHVMTRCKYLDKADRCRIYHSRPRICQEYTIQDCEYDDDWIFEKVFENAEQLREYTEAILPPRKQAEPEINTTYLTLPIDTPTTWDDYDAIRWYLAHGQTLIYLEKKSWFLVVIGQGEIRDREYDDDWIFEKVFETAEQLWEYAEAILPPRRRVKRIEPALTVISSTP